jgi:hypothetical protein
MRRSCDEEKFFISSDGGASGRKKCKRRYGRAYGGVWQSLRLAGVWSQAVGFVLVRLQESGFSSRENVFTFYLLHTEIFRKLCAFSAICKDNAAINCTTVQHKRGAFPSTLTGHTLGQLTNKRLYFPSLGPPSTPKGFSPAT